MSLTQRDLEWLDLVRRFNSLEQNWQENNYRELISEPLFIRIDLFFKVLRRSLDSKPHDEEFRQKFLKQMLGLSFLTGMAEIQLNVPRGDLFI
jgi:hypothetical protein